MSLGCSKASRAPKSRPAARASSRCAAARGRRCCCCTAIRSPTCPGTRSRRVWRANSPWSPPTCAATEIRKSRRAVRITAAIRSAPWRRTRSRGWRRSVSRRALLGIIPQHHLLNNVTRQWGTFSWHWFFMIQPYDFPERLMGADPDYFIEKKLAKTKQGLSFFDPAAIAEYKRYFRNPATVHAMCEDYRATATIDLAMDTKDFEAA